MFSRQQYMNKECSHEQYFRQFVTPFVKALVQDAIGLEAINASTDKHLNDIPLQRWDRLHPGISEITKALRKHAGECNSISTSVCIAKQAARMLQEDEKNGEVI